MPRAAGGPPIYTRLYVHVLIGIALGVLLGYVSPATRHCDEAARRRLHQADSDDDRADHLRDGRRRHRQDGRHEGRSDASASRRSSTSKSSRRSRWSSASSSSTSCSPARASMPTRRTLDPKAVATYTAGAQHLTTVDFLMNIIPTTIVDAFATGDILQVLFFSVLFGLALLHLGERGTAARRPDRSGLACALRHGRHDHVGRVDRRLRRDGVHDRPVRHRHARVARQADRVDVVDLPVLHLRRARRRSRGRRDSASGSS